MKLSASSPQTTSWLPVLLSSLVTLGGSIAIIALLCSERHIQTGFSVPDQPINHSHLDFSAAYLQQPTAYSTVGYYVYPDMLYFYSPIALFALCLPTAALILNHPLIRDKTSFGQLLNYRRLFATIPAPTWLDAWTFHVRQAVSDLLLIEVLMLSVFAFAFLMHVLMGYVEIYIFYNVFWYAYWNSTFIYISGDWAVIFLTLTMIPIHRLSVFTYLSHTSFERIIKYHRWSARVAYLFTVIHMGGIIRDFSFPQTVALYGTFFDRGIHFDYAEDTYSYGKSAAAGFWAMIPFTIVMIMSLEPIRRKQYEIFYGLHVSCGILTVAMAMWHSDMMCYCMIIPIALYGIDKIHQFYNTQLRSVTLLGIRQIVHDSDPQIGSATEGNKPYRLTQLKLQIPSFSYQPGQYIFLTVPQISSFVSHPFSICTAPAEVGEAGMPFVVNVLEQGEETLEAGNQSWTSKLFQVVGYNPTKNLDVTEFTPFDHSSFSESQAIHMTGRSASTPRSEADASKRNSSEFIPLKQSLWMKVDGAYGATGVQMENYPVLVFIAGGTGITPIISLVTAAVRQYKQGLLPLLQSIHLVWVNKHPEAFELWFTEQMAEVASTGIVRLHLYHTAPALKEVSIATSSDETSSNKSMLMSGEPQLNRQEPDAMMSRKVSANGRPFDLRRTIRRSSYARRPNFQLLLSTIRERFGDAFYTREKTGYGYSGGAVYTCGPAGMMRDVHNSALKYSYHLHKEGFSW